MDNIAPRSNPLHKRWITLGIAGLLFISPSVLQGCDALTGAEENETQLQFDDRVNVKTAQQKNKLRHPALLTGAKRQFTGSAGKTGEVTSLFLAFNEYEADGITPRVLNKFEVTNRILEEYGITRRVLGKYGITKRVLSQYDVTRRILQQYDITRRILDKYGITPRVLSKYNDLLSVDLLNSNGLTADVLAEEGLTQEDLDDFNSLSRLLNEHDLTLETFVAELDAAISSIRVKIFIDGVHLGVSIELNSDLLDDLLDEIADDPDILFVEPDITIQISELGMLSDGKQQNQIIPWGNTNVDAVTSSSEDMWTAKYFTNQLRVYVLDSGSMNTSGWDDAMVEEQKDFTMLFENPDEMYWEEDDAQDVTGFDPGTRGNPLDESGHGSHIAGTIGAMNNTFGIIGVAPGVSIHSLKVLTKEGRTDITTLLAAVDYVTRAKLNNPAIPMVVNMSLGVDIGTTTYNVLDEAIEASIEAGVIYVVAAGNDGQNAATYSPAHVTGAITVGAYNEQNLFSSFSNYGSSVDILAPGENIISLSHKINETKSFETILASGTSHAAPYVTGAVAWYLGDNPNATAAQVKAALLESANTEINGVPATTTLKALNVGRFTGTAQDGAVDDSADSNNDDAFTKVKRDKKW